MRQYLRVLPLSLQCNTIYNQYRVESVMMQFMGAHTEAILQNQQVSCAGILIDRKYV